MFGHREHLLFNSKLVYRYTEADVQGCRPRVTLYPNPNSAAAQILKLIDKDADGVELHVKDLMPVRFVPLHGYSAGAKGPPGRAPPQGGPPHIPEL